MQVREFFWVPVTYHNSLVPTPGTKATIIEFQVGPLPLHVKEIELVTSMCSCSPSSCKWGLPLHMHSTARE